LAGGLSLPREMGPIPGRYPVKIRGYISP
jgi:hypothetical protein